VDRGEKGELIDPRAATGVGMSMTKSLFSRRWDTPFSPRKVGVEVSEPEPEPEPELEPEVIRN
jgi:hypothetical protein